MLEAFLLIACALYLLEYSAIRIAQRRLHRMPRSVPAEYPMISVVVAARNEEENIERCLRSLLAQDYPAGRMEIIAVNDESEDATLAIMNRIAEAHPGRITVVCTVPEESHARGKARAIAQGVDRADGEIILLTDADCAPPTTWARAVVEYFAPGVDVYGGFTLVESRDPFSAAQQLDWLHLLTVGSAVLLYGFPVGVVGNNFAFRRSAYEAVGGYRGVRFTVTEDYALFRAMTMAGHRAVFPCDYEARMFTLPCSTIGGVLKQKQRWARGGEENSAPGLTIFAISLLMLIAFILAPFVSPVFWAAVWGTKFVSDLMIMLPSFRRLRIAGQLRYFLLFEFYFVAQVFVIPILLMNRTVVWKGRAYRGSPRTGYVSAD